MLAAELGQAQADNETAAERGARKAAAARLNALIGRDRSAVTADHIRGEVSRHWLATGAAAFPCAELLADMLACAKEG